MLKLPVFMLCSIVSLAIFAADIQPNNPYQVFIPITQTDDASRQAAIKQGLIQVLSRRSGSRKAFSKPEQQAKLQSYATQYLQQYEYRKIQNHPFLVVSFTPDLDSLLPNFGVKLWSEEARPAILSWIVLEKTSTTTWLTPEEAAPETELLTLAATQQGLNLLFPVLDLDDRQLLNFDEVSKGNKKLLQTSATRYNAPVILSGVLSEKAGQWQAKWKLLINGKEQSFESQPAELTLLLQDLMTNIFNRVAPVFVNAPPPQTVNAPTTEASKMSEPPPSSIITAAPMDNKQPFTLQVNNVNNLQDYAKLQQYLKELPQVSQVQTLQITPNSVSFQLTLKADNASFIQVLNSSRQLTPNPDNTYRYVP
jgi:hypothetical protein